MPSGPPGGTPAAGPGTEPGDAGGDGLQHRVRQSGIVPFKSKSQEVFLTAL